MSAAGTTTGAVEHLAALDARQGVGVWTSPQNARREKTRAQSAWKGHGSDTGFWRIRNRSARKIPEGARLHTSVITRMKYPANGYLPQNLSANYFVVD